MSTDTQTSHSSSFLFPTALLLVLITLYHYLQTNTNFFHSQETEAVHYHAGFQMYKNNQLQDFSDLKYMSVKPCVVTDHDHQDEPIEKVHLHDNVGDVVHVHAPEVIWNDLLTYLHYSLDASASAYLNGQQIIGFPNTPIVAYDSVVIFEGENQDIDTKYRKQVTQEHIISAENSSENCGL